MDNFGFEIQTDKYDIRKLSEVCEVLGLVLIIIIMLCIFKKTRRHNSVQNRVKRYMV